MKKTHIALSLVFAALLFGYAGAQRPQNPGTAGGENFLGTLREGVYRNEFFGFRLSVPSNLFPLTSSEIDFAKNLGAKTISGNISGDRAAWEKAATAEVMLLAVTDKSPGSLNTSTLAVGAMRQPSGVSSRIVTNVSKEFLLKSPNFRVVEDTHTVQLAGREFSLVRMEADFHGLTANFDYYATMQKGHSLTFVITYLSEEARRELEKALKSLTFSR